MSIGGYQVVVHLGHCPVYVGHNVGIAALALPDFETFLIVDRKMKQAPKGVTILNVDSLVENAEVRKICASLSNLGIDPKWRGGYWPKVFLRFSALRALMTKVESDKLSLQLESDILSAITPALIEPIDRLIGTACGIPFIDSNTGGPGVMFAAKPSILSEVCQFVLDQLNSGMETSDMKALALAKRDGLVMEMPSVPGGDALRMGIWLGQEYFTAEVLFDAAAVGQFLFGIDPRNNGGVLIPGYRERRGDIDPGLWRDWSIVECEDGTQRVACLTESGPVVFANLHIHSKQALPPIDKEDQFWSRVIRIANGFEGSRPQIDLKYLTLNKFKNILRMN